MSDEEFEREWEEFVEITKKDVAEQRNYLKTIFNHIETLKRRYERTLDAFEKEYDENNRLKIQLGTLHTLKLALETLKKYDTDTS